MARYRKKPVVIEALCWGAALDPPSAEWFVAGLQDGDIKLSGDTLVIWNNDNYSVAERGDYVVRGTSGELYAIKAAIFADLYEPAD